MICSKCNSEIPNGARFCTVCGAACEAAPEQKNVCSNCGAELKVGAKFCPVCGTAAVNAAPTGGDGMTPVSLNKEPNANDLVATMNTAAATASAPAAGIPVPAPMAEAPMTVPMPAMETPVPMPAPAMETPMPAPAMETPMPAPAMETPMPAPAMETPMPAPAMETPMPAPAAEVPMTAPIPTPTPAADYNGGFSGAAPAMPQAPTYAPAGNGVMPPMGGDVNGLNGAAAAVAAPIKKKSAGKIVLIIAIVLVVLLGGAAVFFFTNKATALSIVMGKPKYAAMIEKESLKKATENMDMKVVSDQIKSVSSMWSTFAVSDINPSNALDMIGLSNKSDAGLEFAKLAATSYPINDGVDIKAMLKGYNEYMQSLYGANRISGSISASVSLGSELSSSEIDEMLRILNNSKITYDLASTKDFMGGELGIDIDGAKLNAKAIIEEDGTVYLLFPFASDKALKYKVTTVENTAATSDTSAVLDLDSEEIERLINEVVDIYSNYIKDSAVTMGKGSLNVAGIVVEGKQITADINGKALENLFKEAFEHVANDEYFCGKIVDYIKSFEPDFTESDYKNAITDIVKDMTDTTTDQKLIVTTIVNNSGKVLAKNYSFSDRGETIGSIAFADNDTTSAFDFKIGDQSLITVKNVKTNDTDGSLTVKFGIDSQSSIGIVADYTGVGTADFGNTKIPVGTYTISLDTSSINDNSVDSETMNAINSFAITFGTTVESKTAKYTVGFSAEDIMDLKLNADVTLSDDVSGFSAPSNVFDLAPIIDGGNIDDATIQQFYEYISEIAQGATDAIKGTVLEDLLGGLISGITPPKFEEEPLTPPIPEPEKPNEPATPPTADDVTFYDNVADFAQRISDEYDELLDLVGDDQTLQNIAEPYALNLVDLFNELTEYLDKDCPQEQLEAFHQKFAEILAQKKTVVATINTIKETTGATGTPGDNSNASSDASNPSTSDSAPGNQTGGMSASGATAA